jgi:DNA-binding LacI/PurR family transcriptional regulator
MRDVARAAGVSYTTVSYVLNQRETPRGIGESTKQRVIQAADALGYRRNALARAVVTGESAMLGFITRAPQADAEYIARVLMGFLEEANQHGYLVKALYVPEADLGQAAVEACLRWRVAGVALVGLPETLYPNFLQALLPVGVPVAIVESLAIGQGEVAVLSDEEGGIREAMEHFRRLGHQRVGFLAASRNDRMSQRRVALFESLARANDLEPTVAFGDWWESGVNEAAMATLLDAVPAPTAILCSSDAAAMTAIRVARARHLHIPKDLSVVGYGNYTMAALTDPPLTTIAQPFHALGQASVQRLLQHLQKTTTPVTITAETLPTALVLRHSTASPNG